MKRNWDAILQIARRESVLGALRFAYAAHGNSTYRQQWLAFVEEYAEANGLEPAGIDLLMKPLNQFVVVDLPMDERIRLLRAHYCQLASLVSPTLLAHLWSGRTAEAEVFSGKKQSYHLLLCATPVLRTRKEGEITIAVRHVESGEILAKLTFLLTLSGSGVPSMIIGGIQGTRAPSAKQLIISATRDLHGLRPRDAVLLGALAIARRIGANEVWAVPSGMHVHNARDLQQRRRMFTDYDEYWAERGARQVLPFGWLLDVPQAPTHTGTTSPGRKRDAVKDVIWNLAQSGFSGTIGTVPVESANTANRRHSHADTMVALEVLA